jgi:hypothetical protein
MMPLRTVLLWALVALAAPAAAADAPPLETTAPPPNAAVDEPLLLRQRTFHLSGYLSHWVNSNLPPFLYNAATGKLTFADAYFAAVGGATVVVPRFDLILPGTSFGLRGNSIEIEAQGVKHFGFQDHVEGTIAAVVRSGEVPLFGGLSVNVAWGNGFSYAFSDPDYEKGPDSIRGVDTRRLQYYMGFETEFTHASEPDIHLVAKLHHRSGIYGVISPQRTGSNYIGAGIRFDFR